MNRAPESIIVRMMWSALITASLSLAVAGQQQNRIVDWQSVRIMSDARVLEIINIKIDGNAIIIGQPFAANEDWLNRLTFRVRNISSKNINEFGFGVAFPEIKADGHTPMFSLAYGANYSSKRDSGASRPLLPNGEVDLKLPEDQVEIMRRVSFKATGTSNLRRVNILPGLVTFEDGSKIGGISLRRRVPE